MKQHCGVDKIKITSSSDVEFITNEDDIRFKTGSILLDGGGTTKITTGTGGAGAITIDGAVDSEASTAENFQLISGTGTITVEGAMGAVVNLGTIDINSTDAGGGTNDGAGDIELRLWNY